MPQASLPSPRTWAANDLVTAPRLRADAANAIAFLSARPMFAGQVTTGRSWASGSDLPMMLDSELYDSWNGHQPGTAVSGSQNPSQYYAQVPGWYLCRSAPAFNFTSITPAVMAGSLQGVTGGTSWGPQRGPLVLCGSGSPPVTQCVDLIAMSATGPPGGAGDYVQFDAFQSSGSSVNLNAAPVQLPAASARWACALSGTQPLPVPPLTAVPTPITHAWLNANLRDTIAQLAYPPICRAFYTAGSSTLASSTFPTGSVIQCNTVTVDNYGGYNTSTFAYTAPLAGRYYVYGQYSLASSSTSTGYGCGISVNGGATIWGDVLQFAPGASLGGGACAGKRLRLNAGDQVQLRGNQGSGSAIAYNASGANPTRLVIVWEGI